jgi:Transposase domain (DUF772)
MAAVMIGVDLHKASHSAAAIGPAEELISDLGETRWTGRPGYAIRAMVGAALVKAVYALPTWTRTVRLIAEHAALREAIGGAPSHWACYRFAVKLRDHGDMLAACIDRVLATLRAADPALGETVAIDGPYEMDNSPPTPGLASSIVVAKTSGRTRRSSLAMGTPRHRRRGIGPPGWPGDSWPEHRGRRPVMAPLCVKRGHFPAG